MADQKPKSTKVQESRETMGAVLIVFLVESYLASIGKPLGADVLLMTYGALGTKMGLFMYGKGKEYQANTAVEVAKTQASAPANG